VDSFMVVVFGGVGNVWGTLVAGLSLGIANKFLEPVAGAVVAKDVTDYALVVGVPARRVGWVCRCGDRLPSTQDERIVCASCGNEYAHRDGTISPIKEVQDDDN